MRVLARNAIAEALGATLRNYAGLSRHGCLDDAEGVEGAVDRHLHGCSTCRVILGQTLELGRIGPVTGVWGHGLRVASSIVAAVPFWPSCHIQDLV